MRNAIAASAEVQLSTITRIAVMAAGLLTGSSPEVCSGTIIPANLRLETVNTAAANLRLADQTGKEGEHDEECYRCVS